MTLEDVEIAIAVLPLASRGIVLMRLGYTTKEINAYEDERWPAIVAHPFARPPRWKPRRP